MTPRELGLPTGDSQIQEAVAFYSRNKKFDSYKFDRPSMVRLLQRRRFDDPETICLALLGGLPPALDGLLRKTFSALPNLAELIAQNRLLHEKKYDGIATAPDSLKAICLATAISSLDDLGDTRIADATSYRDLGDALDNNTPDQGLTDIFSAKLESRRKHNLENIGFPPFEETPLPDHIEVRSAYSLLRNFAEDGRLQPDNFKNALLTTSFLSKTDGTNDPVTLATCLIDLGLLHDRRYTDSLTIHNALSTETSRKLSIGSARHIHTPNQFASIDPTFRNIYVASFISDSLKNMHNLERLSRIFRHETDSPIVQKRLAHLRENETRARTVILPALEEIGPPELYAMFLTSLSLLTKFNVGNSDTIPPPQLTGKPPQP